MVEASRRGFLTGLGVALITAPAIVRASSLMAVKALEEDVGFDVLVQQDDVWGEMTDIVRRAFVPRLYVQIYQQTPLLRFALESTHDAL